MFSNGVKAHMYIAIRDNPNDVMSFEYIALGHERETEREQETDRRRGGKIVSTHS